MKEMWDERYSAEIYVYGKSPNAFFREQLDRLAPGRLLLPAEGEGRNAVYAAGRGWQVDAFDYSDAGFRKAMALAKEFGVQINYQVTPFDNYNFQKEQYNSIGLIYFHLPASQRESFHRKIIDSLVPGGTIILEAYHKTQLGRNTGGPQSPELLYDEKSIVRDFKNLFIKKLNVLTVHREEGLFHSGEARVIQCVATKSNQ